MIKDPLLYRIWRHLKAMFDPMCIVRPSSNYRHVTALPCADNSSLWQEAIQLQVTASFHFASQVLWPTNRTLLSGRFLAPNMLAQRLCKCRHLFAFPGVQVACAMNLLVFHTWKEMCCYVLLLHIRFRAVWQGGASDSLVSNHMEHGVLEHLRKRAWQTLLPWHALVALKLASTKNLTPPTSYHSEFWVSTMPTHDTRIEYSECFGLSFSVH